MITSFAESIRLYHECEGWIEKSVLSITNWNHKACQVMTNVDCEGRIFLSRPQTMKVLFFLLTKNTVLFLNK